jgi:hypothetical protein
MAQLITPSYTQRAQHFTALPVVQGSSQSLLHGSRAFVVQGSNPWGCCESLGAIESRGARAYKRPKKKEEKNSKHNTSVHL